MPALAPSGIRAIFDRAHALEAEGRSIVHMEIGRPDFDSPPAAKRAAAAALERGEVHYTASRGLAELREAISAKLAERNGLEYDPASEIVVTAGGSEAVLAIALAACEPGDAAVVLDPSWPHYVPQLSLAGVTAARVPCRPEDGFVPDPERVEAALPPRARLLVISSPSNPTGAVIPADVLAALAGVAERNDLLVVSDEIYERFVYDGAEHVSMAALPGMRGRVAIANSFSKTYSMTGWRIGFVAAPSELAARVTAVHQYISVCAPSFAQRGAIAALRDGEDFVAEMVATYGRRRTELLDGLAGLAAIELDPPPGAFYAFPRLADGTNATDVAMRLLEEAGVAVVPGAVFGNGFEAHMRVSYAISRESLAAGVERLRSFLG
jgi:aminotransferase